MRAPRCPAEEEEGTGNLGKDLFPETGSAALQAGNSCDGGSSSRTKTSVQLFSQCFVERGPRWPVRRRGGDLFYGLHGRPTDRPTDVFFMQF